MDAFTLLPYIAAVDNYYACGSGSGVISLYENKINGNKNRGNPASAPPLPTKSIMSLTTRTDVLRFNSDETLLAIASQMKKDSLKIFHVPSKTVYSNWPTAQTPLHYVTSVDFSVNSGMLAIGNDRGKILLYEAKALPECINIYPALEILPRTCVYYTK